jgi:glycosyltransferase involved in cell wall biosynthesis
MSTKEDLHILILSSWYPHHEAPASGIFIQRFSEWLAEYYKVSVIFIKSEDDITETYFEERRSFNLHEIIGYYPKPKGFFQRLVQIARYKKVLDLAVEKLSSRPDLIHAHVSYPKGKEFEYVARKLNIGYIIHEHSSDFSDYAQKRWTKFKRRLIVSTLRNSRMVLSVSPFLEHQVLKTEPYLVHAVLPLPVDLTLFRPNRIKQKKEDYTFIHVSGLDERFKNVKGIVEAFSRVHNNNPNSKLKIVTDGDVAPLHEYIKENGFASGLEILENLSHEEVAEQYRLSDCFVLFSEFETYSCVLIEALASGLEVIATKVGIANDLDESLIHIVPRKDIHALMTTMENRLLMNKNDLNPQALVRAAKQFSSEEVLEKLRIVYNTVLQRNNL